MRQVAEVWRERDGGLSTLGLALIHLAIVSGAVAGDPTLAARVVEVTPLTSPAPSRARRDREFRGGAPKRVALNTCARCFVAVYRLELNLKS